MSALKLHLYQSPRLEDLGLMLSELIKRVPLSDPFAKETIVVQSKGMGRWLTLYLANQNGIAANLDFILPAALAWQLVLKVLPDLPKKSSFTPDVLKWRLMALIPTLGDVVYAPLKNYIGDSETALSDIAGKIADIFDQYLVFRPNWIQKWEAGELLDLGPNEAWQAALWKVLAEEDDGVHRVRMLEQFIDQLTERHVPERVILFGISNLAPMYLAMLKKLSKLTDVCVFTLNPCEEYWGDLRDKRGFQFESPKPEEQGHPLLASLGKQGRDFFDLIAGDVEWMPNDIVLDTLDTNRLLHRLQSDIRYLNHPDLPSYAKLPKEAIHDGSIDIHSAHSPMRELEILKDQLLNRFAADRSLTPADVAVLTPDINHYAPYINSVFAKRSDETDVDNIPYTIADRTQMIESPLLLAFGQVLDLLTSRFKAEEVLALLNCQALLQRFELDSENIPFLEKWVQDAAIAWGRDAEHKASLDLPADPIRSWRWGLDRLLLGSVLPPDMAEASGNAVWHDLLPQGGAEGQFAEILAKFASLYDVLENLALTWQVPCDLKTWGDRLTQAAYALFDPNDEDESALDVIRGAAEQLVEDSELAGYHQEVNLPVIRDWLVRQMSLSTSQGFLNGGVTFCAMVPMRSIPFKLICLIGMNDGAYPRDERPVSFDLIAKHPNKGDRSRRFDDRYLFLEALMSARESLYLSYVGRSIRTNEPLPPSSLIAELMDTIGSMVEGGLPKDFVCEHPLQAFSRQNYLASRPNLQSYETSYAKALLQAEQPESERVTSAFFDFNRPLKTSTNEPLYTVSLGQFTKFWRNPTRTWLKERLGMRLPHDQDDEVLQEPFTLNKDSVEAIQEWLVTGQIEQKDTQAITQMIWAKGWLPSQALGEAYIAQQIGKSKDTCSNLPEAVLNEEILPPVSIDLDLPCGLRLIGELSGIRPSGLYFVSFDKHNNSDKVEHWLKHLILCCLCPESVIPVTYSYDEQEVLKLHTLSAEEAFGYLDTWATYYQQSQTEPILFFPKMSLAYATKIQVDKPVSFDQIKESLIKDIWAKPSYGSFLPLKDKVENALLYKQLNPLEDDDSPFYPIANALLGPYCQHVQKEKKENK